MEMSDVFTWKSRGWNNVEYSPGEVLVISDTSDGGGYEWTITSVVAKYNGDIWEYAVYSDGGCSCNYPYEDSPDKYDLDWCVSFRDVIRRAGECIDSQWDVSNKIEAKSKMSVNVAKFVRSDKSKLEHSHGE